MSPGFPRARVSRSWLASCCVVALLLTGCGPATPAVPAVVETPTEEQLALRAASPFVVDSALAYTRHQIDAGPRVPGTEAHRAVGDWLVATLRQRGGVVQEQTWSHQTRDGQTLQLRNIGARFGPATGPRLLYIAHWDTRPLAEKDADATRRAMPIPGANDGAAAVGMLLEVARQLSLRAPAIGVDLVFVDGEDWGDFQDRARKDVLIGSQYLAAHPLFPNTTYTWGVVWDLVATPNGEFAQEATSIAKAPNMILGLWEISQALGYTRTFPARVGAALIDDHLPLQEAGLPVGVMIAYDGFAAHHTHGDTFEALDTQTLKRVGDVALLRLYATAKSGPAIPGAAVEAAR